MKGSIATMTTMGDSSREGNSLRRDIISTTEPHSTPHANVVKWFRTLRSLALYLAADAETASESSRESSLLWVAFEGPGDDMNPECSV